MLFKRKDDKLLRPNVVADMLDVSRNTVYRLIKTGELDSIRTSPHNIRIYRSSVDKYLKKLNPDMICDESDLVASSPQ